MRAMLLREPRRALEATDIPPPRPADGQLLVKVDCCAVCRTDLHVVDGELENAKLPLVIGHQIVGTTDDGRRVGIPWLGWTCGVCAYCTSGRENLCDRALFTGYTLDGGYAEYAVADARYCFPIPDDYSSEEAAPLLCAGLIGYRAYRMTGDARTLGFYGFGSSAHILAQIARADGRTLFAFTRDGDAAAQELARRVGAGWAGGAGEGAQELARRVGAGWAGGAGEGAPEPLDAAIVFAPAGELVVAALRNVKKGGSVVCAGIHMSDIPSFPYALLWGERSIRSVANLTRADGIALFERLKTLRIETQRTTYPLELANKALSDLRSSAITGTAVITL